MNSIKSTDNKRAGKSPMARPPPRRSVQTKKLEKQVAAAEKKIMSLEKNQSVSNVYDDQLDLLSDDDEESDVNFDTSNEDDDDEEEEEEDDDSVSRSLSSDDENSSEESRRLNNKRKAPPLCSFGGKVPRSQNTFAQARALCEQKEAEADASFMNKEELEMLRDTIKLSIVGLDRINDTALENINKAQEMIHCLEEKERAQIADNLFVVDHKMIEKELKEREVALKQREESAAAILAEVAKKQAEVEELKQQSAALEERARILEEEEKRNNSLAAMLKSEGEAFNIHVRDLEKRTYEITAIEKQLIQREEELNNGRKDVELKLSMIVEKEKALANVKPVKPVLPTNPLDGFVQEMNSKNLNMLSRLEMMAIVPKGLVSNLAYLGGKQRLKYTSLSNSKYLIMEVSSLSENEQPELLMRQIVSKQLYTPK